MGRRGKKNQKLIGSASASASVATNNVDPDTNARGRGSRGEVTEKSKNKETKQEPQIVEEIDDSDDEEIPEDEAFNSEDERLFGHYFVKRHDYVEGSDDDDDDADSNGNDEEDDDDTKKKRKKKNVDSLSSDDDDEVTSDDDDDDDKISDEEDDDDDGGQYMLDLLNKLDDPSSNNNNNSHDGDDNDKKLSYSQMGQLRESDYSSSMSSSFRTAKNEITLDNLMEGIQDTKGFRDMQNSLSKVPTSTPVPMAKIKTDRMERKMMYGSRSKDVSRWIDVIQENRQAESLDFKPKERNQLTRDVLVDKFVPKTDFEKEIEAALNEAGQKEEIDVLMGEEQALQDDLGSNRLTMEEYKHRRGQLAQIRALMFYHERKRHQMNKIKSKKYRRIRKKQRDRLKESAVSDAIEQGDDELAKELQEKDEVARVQERMTLAHKNTSKWAKRILKRGKNVDIDTRRALSAQLKLGDDLRKKMMGYENDNSDDDDDDEENLVHSARKVLEDTENDPDPTHGKTGLFKLSFMQKGIEKQRQQAREEAKKLLGELEANSNIDDYDDILQNDDDKIEVNETTVNQKKNELSEKEMKQVLKRGELVASSLEFGHSNAFATSTGIEIDLGTDDTDDDDDGDNQSKGDDDDDDDDDSSAAENDDSQTGNSSTKKKRNMSIVNSGGGNSTSEYVMEFEKVAVKKIKSNASSSASKQKRKEKASMTPTERSVTNTDDNKAEHDNPWMESVNKTNPVSQVSKKEEGPGLASAKKAKRTGIVDVAGAAKILDAGDKTNDRGKNSEVRDVEESTTDIHNGSGEKGEKKITMLTQEELVRKAFVGENESQIDEAFRKEKEAMAAEADPTRKVGKDKSDSDDVAGWGSWTGEGSLPPKPRRLPKKLQAPKRKKNKDEKKKRYLDEFKPDVIINHKRLKKTANTYMLGDVPHPYASRAEYEQAMLGGIGREWNVSSSFKDMTRSEILTRSGKIIQPLSKKAKRPRPAAKF